MNMTKAQLVDECVRLRAHCAVVEQQREEAIEALHRLKGELLASKLPMACSVSKVWVDDLGRYLPVGFAHAREAAMRAGHAVKIGA